MELSNYLNKKQYYNAPSPTDEAILVYNHHFNAWLNRFPAEQRTEIAERLTYINQYVSQYPEFDGEEWSIPFLAIEYYEKRDKILKDLFISECYFDNFTMMQTAIVNLGLLPKPTFELIVFLWNILIKWEGKGKLRLGMKLRDVVDRITNNPEDYVTLEIKVGKKHFEFDNGKFVKAMIATYLNYDNEADLLEEEVNTKTRELSYILVRTLLNNLPIKHKKEKKGTFSQAERNFSLGVLWLNGGIIHKPDEDPELRCCNAIFDQLMRNNKNTRLPIVLPSLLETL